MSVSVIERRRIITHAEDASIVLWLLKRKRWKYELDNGVEVVDSEDSESRRTCLYASLFISICVARLGGLPVSHSLAGWQPQLRRRAFKFRTPSWSRCHWQSFATVQSICYGAMLDLQHLSNFMGFLASRIRK